MQTIEALTAQRLELGRVHDFVRYLSLVHVNHGFHGQAGEAFAAQYPRSPNIELVRKAAVGAGTTTDATWAAPLATGQSLESAFLEFLRPRTIIGRLPLRPVPFKVSVPIQTGAGVYQWVGEGGVKPITKLAYGSKLLDVRKVAGLLVVSDELMRLSVPGVEGLLRDEIANGLAQLIDTTFVDQSLAPTSDVPGGITNGVTPIAPSGTTAAALVKDIGTLRAQFWTNNPGATRARLLMLPVHAEMLVAETKIQTLKTDEGGLYNGMTVIVSANVGNRIICLDAGQVLFADGGGVSIDLSLEASVQMSDAPDNPATAATVLRNLWQNNEVGLRGEWMANWTKARATAVSLIAPTAYVP